MERIYVTVRARPLSSEDAKSSPWRISGNSIAFSNQSCRFEFDRIFGEECKTKEVYEARTKAIVAAAVQGFNGTVFAYGQTNSGKTHTMRGSAIEPGVIPLAVRNLFDTIQEVTNREFLLRMSYMEIYNEEINDLLAPEHRRLQIHESLERGIFVAGLREEIVASPEQVLDLMEFGESHRHIGETNMNLHSSRSHTIFRMIIESRDKEEDEELGDSCDAVRVSVLNLVDLAGSERAAKTGAEGVRLKEGSHINKSLMTLGTVIKRLSEGAESQGGHVPYRDSKLTRILQPALGGNANTAIICNITLAQVHADETKSSLQFASRALRVTNCARVNEILTDAALLKRQKKEIEELRAKLQASHSDHLEEEILSLRNTLLQTELERERIALELEEEKRAHVEREKRLQEQAKKIKNLSSMVLYSNRDEIRGHHKKDKRRDTWCPGNLAREISREISRETSAVRNARPERKVGRLVPFEELLNESEAAANVSCWQEEKPNDPEPEDCVLPDPCTLLNVTNRRKVSQRKKIFDAETNEVLTLQAEYDDLLQKFETQRIMYDVKIDCLERRLDESYAKEGNQWNQLANESASLPSKSMPAPESEAIAVIKQLEEQITKLEWEKSSSLDNLNKVIEMATEQNVCATKEYGELYKELLDAKAEASIARNQLTSGGSSAVTDEEIDSIIKLLLEVQEILTDVQSLTLPCESISSVADELFQSHLSILNQISTFRSLVHENSMQLQSISNDHMMLVSYMKDKITELENEKLRLQNENAALQEKMQEIVTDGQNSEKAIAGLSEQHELEKTELFSHIQALQIEVSSLASSSLSREKESLRKDLEKTKSKLKETESKLKNIIQEKTRIEGEKANAEREVKKLHGQKALLERDIHKRDSLASRRRDSSVDWSSKCFDSKKLKAHDNSYQQLQDDYKKLEVLAFEMEATIASLEEELAAANHKKEELSARNESLASELEVLSDKLNASSTELSALHEEITNLRVKLEKFEAGQQELESQVNLVAEEKEELATQLTNALLELEEERAIWSAKEKASIEAIKEKADVYNNETTSLSSEISKVRNEMSSFKKECEVLQERLQCAAENVKLEKRGSLEKMMEIERLRNDLEVAENEKNIAQESLLSKLEKLSSEHSHTSNQLQAMTEERNKLIAQIEEQQCNSSETEFLKKHYDDKLLKAKCESEELLKRVSDLELMMHNDQLKKNKERAKLRMMLRLTQAKLDAFRERYKEAVDGQEFMDRKYEEATSKLKDRLASYAFENLDLKKQLSAAGLHCT